MSNAGERGYSVGVRDHIMIAHSLPDAVFGPARALHGATYVVDVELSAGQLNRHNIVIDIGVLTTRVSEVLAQLNYSNLDEVESLSGQLTTTEFVARHIHQALSRRLLGDEGIQRDLLLQVTLHESHVAWARYRGPLE